MVKTMHFIEGDTIPAFQLELKENIMKFQPSKGKYKLETKLTFPDGTIQEESQIFFVKQHSSVKRKGEQKSRRSKQSEQK